jgi:hypothetical protein
MNTAIAGINWTYDRTVWFIDNAIVKPLFTYVLDPLMKVATAISNALWAAGEYVWRLVEAAVSAVWMAGERLFNAGYAFGERIFNAVWVFGERLLAIIERMVNSIWYTFFPEDNAGGERYAT